MPKQTSKIQALPAGLHNMRDAGMLHPRHFFQRCKVTGDLTAEEMFSAWGNAEVNDTFCQVLSYENIKSAWERADAFQTHCTYF